MSENLTVSAVPDYLRADSLDVAVAALALAPRKILAGGTDVFPSLQDRPLGGAVLDISGIAELRRIGLENGYWHIGAAASWSDVIKADLPPAFDGLKAAAREVGSVQIQNRATLAGNLCNASPAADGVPPLLTLDAEVEIISHTGLRSLPLPAFILGNRKTALGAGEMVAGLKIPTASATGISDFFKLGSRSYLVISISMAAVRLDVNAAGIITMAAVAIGACSEVAQRMPDVEAALVGSAIADVVGKIHPRQFASLAPIDDVRAPASYRNHVAVQAVRHLLEIQQSAHESTSGNNGNIPV